MLSFENPPPDPSTCPCEISKLNSSCCSSSSSFDDQPPSGVLQSDLLESCPKFTIRDYAFSNRSKDIKTNWPFSEKSLQLCLNHGVKDLLPPIQSLDVVKTPAAQRCAIATSLLSKEIKYHLIDQPSRPTNDLLAFTSDEAQPSSTSVHTSPIKSRVRIFSSMVVEAEASLNHPASKPVKKLAPVANKVENIMKPLTKKCREIVKLNNTVANQNKLENNTSNNFLVSETMASKVCPVCKMFTSSSNTTLNAHIDQCLSGESVSQWTSDPKETKSRIKPKRMRSMIDIYATAQHCTIEELERRNGINLASCSSLPDQYLEVGSVGRKRNSPVDFEEMENEAVVYVDVNGKKLRILSMLDDLSASVMAVDDIGTRRNVDGNKSNKLCLDKKKKKKKKLQEKRYKLQEKHHKVQVLVSDSNKSCSRRSPRHHQKTQINFIQEHSSGAEDRLEVEEEFAKPQRAHGLIKYIEPESVVGRRACAKRSNLIKLNGKGDQLHSSWTRENKLAGVNTLKSPRNPYVNGGSDSKSNMSSGTPPASSRSSEAHDDYGRVLSLRRSVRESGSSDRNNPLGEGNQKEMRDSNSSVKYRNKDEFRNKLNPVAFLSIRKVKMKRDSARNVRSVGDTSKHFFDEHDLSISRGFSSFTQKQVSRLADLQASAPKSTFRPNNKNLNRPHAYCESDSDGGVRKTVTNLSDNVIIGRRAVKVRRDGGKVKVSGKGGTLVFKDIKSTRKHYEHRIDGTNDSYFDNDTAGSDNEKESTHKNVQPCEEDDVDEATCNNNSFIEACRGLSKSSDVQCHEVDGHLDVQSDSQFDSPGSMKFCDGPSVGTEDARYPVDSILNGGEKTFCIDGDGKSIFGQDNHATTELHSNDGSGSYYAEVDLIPIPGPSGSFLPSPSLDEFELHGNSSPTSNQDQLSENHHEFADRDSSDSPSPTSTISNSDIAKFDSTLIERFPFRHNIQDVMRSSVSNATGDTMVDKISLDPSVAFVGGGGLTLIQPKVHSLYTETSAPLGLKNDQPCRCSRRDGAVLSSAVLKYPDTSLLSWSTMPLVPGYLSNAQVDCDETRQAKNGNLLLNVPSSGHLAGEILNATGDPQRLIPTKACTNSGMKFFFNTDGESVSPSPNPILRLMGKDLMVVNKEESSYSPQTGKERIAIDEASQPSADIATLGMGLMNHRGASINPALIASGVSPRNSKSMYN